MQAKEFAEMMAKWAAAHPTAEVLVEGLPVIVEILPAYYDGPSKRLEGDTLVFIRSGVKIQLSAYTYDLMVSHHPDLKLDMRELPEWQHQFYLDKVGKAKLGNDG